MDERNWVIADIPVRKGLEERYCVHVNVANVSLKGTLANKTSRPML